MVGLLKAGMSAGAKVQNTGHRRRQKSEQPFEINIWFVIYPGAGDHSGWPADETFSTMPPTDGQGESNERFTARSSQRSFEAEMGALEVS